jgi:hypothetical protein
MVEELTGGGELSWRNRISDGTWAPYKTAFHRGNIVGTVSQAAGVPTGAIIQRGSNVNGEFVRFADGTQICTLTLKTTHSANTTLFSYGWTYPSPFSAAVASPVVSGTFWCIEQGVAFRRGILTRSNTEPVAGQTQTAVAGADVASGVFNESVMQLQAIGRWFN